MYFYGVVNKKVANSTPKQICKTSVEMNAKGHLAGLSLDTEFNCPTQYISIDKKNKEEVMKELAMKMYDCWDMWGEGKSELFPQKEGQSITYCKICHHIVFKEKQKIAPQEFYNYLNKHTIPKDNLLPKQRTFSEYFSNSVPKEELGNEDLSKYYIDTSAPYVTMFTYSKVGYWSKVTTGAAGTLGGMIAGAVLTYFTGGGFLILVAIGGAGGGWLGYSAGSDIPSDWQASIHLLPYEVSQLQELNCTYLPVSQG
jgi:hypothetical protein